MGNCVRDNPLRTRSDVERAAVQLIEPLLPLLSPNKARLHLGDTGAVYPDDIAQMEAFARPLWAIVPMLAGHCASVKPLWAAWREGIIAGVDPENPEYWGEVVDYDQRLVEMAVFGMGMALAPKEFFFDLPEKTQKQLHAWLDQINRRDMPKNNWTFFRVLVNMGFIVCGMPYDEARMQKDFAMIEEHYEGDGWYFDYFNQREYYTMWAFHFYGLVYAKVMRERDPARSREYVGRGRKMAVDFACWFDRSGEALAYGRSLTYRFAQGAFYAALALAEAETEEVNYGQMKHLLLGNMRKWFAKPIFTRDGVLTIGYGYPSLLMAEGYNAPGSPYWAMKAFACLALPEEHPFWQAEEQEIDTPKTALQPHARMLITHSDDKSHVTAFVAGNRAHEHSHDEAKYEKFVYSSVFGFSVSKAQKLLKDGAFDNMLALSEDGDTWHPRYGCDGSVVYAQHARTPEEICENGRAVVIAPWGVSGVMNLSGYDGQQNVMPEPNTNLMAPRTLIPTLTARIGKGETVLVSAVFGTKTAGRDAWENPPTEVLTYGKMD